MKRITTIGIFIFFISLQLNAQSDLREGYLIKNNNDTIYGLIDYSFNKTNAQKCTFKEGPHSEIQVFNPDEIKGFKFLNSKYYASKTIKSDDTERTVFLEYLINGKIGILYLRGLDKYYLEKNDQVYELKNTVEVINKNGFYYEQDRKEYIGLMTYLLQDANIRDYILKAELNHKSLIKIAKEYHNKVSTEDEYIIYEKKIAEKNSTYGVFVGFNTMSIAETGDFSEEMYYLRNSQFGWSLYPSFGVYYKVNMPGENEKIFFQYEGTYSYVNVTSSHSFFEPVYDMTFFNDIDWTQNSFNNLITLKHESLPGKAVRPTFQIGGFFKYTLQQNTPERLKS